MAIQGLRDTSNFVADQRPKNWRNGVLLEYPNGMAPLFALTNLMKSKSTDDPEFAWWEKSKQNQRFVFSTSLNNTDTTTTITLSSGGNGIMPRHVLRVEGTEELLLVTTVISDTSIQVTRGFAGSTKTAWNPATSGNNPNLLIVGSAFPEGSAAPGGISYDPTKRRNFTQIFRNTLEITRTASKTRLRTGDAVKEAKRECLELHSGEIEKAMLFGIPYEGTLDGKPHRMTGGIIHFIDSANKVTVSGGNLSFSLLEGYMAEIFRFGSKEKIGFCGNTGLLAIQRAIRKNATYQLMQGEKEWGMNVQRLVSPFGTLVLKTHPLWNEVVSGTNTTAYYALDTWLLVLDQNELEYRYIDDTTYEAKLQANGLDSEQSGYLTECGLEIHFPKSHYLIKGLVNGVADS